MLSTLATRRPWLDYYLPLSECLLAQRISSTNEKDAEDNDNILPIEMWLAVCHCFPQENFRSICALGATCHALQPLSCHPQLFERLCRSAFALPGYRPCESVMRLFAWSWRLMFMWRKRLRFDGLYFVATTKLLAGLNEGRGMKEKDKECAC